MGYADSAPAPGPWTCSDWSRTQWSARPGSHLHAPPLEPSGERRRRISVELRARGQLQEVLVRVVDLLPPVCEVRRERDGHHHRRILVLGVDRSASLCELVADVVKRGNGLVAVLQSLDEPPYSVVGAARIASLRGAVDNLGQRRGGVSFSLSHLWQQLDGSRGSATRPARGQTPRAPAPARGIIDRVAARPRRPTIEDPPRRRSDQVPAHEARPRGGSPRGGRSAGERG